MKKIPSLFVRDFNDNPELVTAIKNPLCQWVFDGLGTASIKRDGTCCMIRNGRLFRRFDAKRGKPTPPNFEACQEPDEITGHYPGWIPIGPDDKWHLWWAYHCLSDRYENGTYEMCGPKVQDNAERLNEIRMFRHGSEIVYNAPRTYFDLKMYFSTQSIEGLVFKNGDEMCKIKRSDFGYEWPIKRG